MARVRTGFLLALTAVAAAGPVFYVVPEPPPGTPSAQPGAAPAYAGVLFTGPLSGPHGCSATAVTTGPRDRVGVVVTAAHCVNSAITSADFVPGFDNGSAPFGAWRITGAYVDPAWLSRQDPGHDAAVLTVQPLAGRTLAQTLPVIVTVGSAPAAGTPIALAGYNTGTGGRAQICETVTYVHAGRPAYNCRGYSDGTSGTGWIAHTRTRPALVGVIGGLHQGGCHDFTSYSSALGPWLRTLVVRGERLEHSDLVPKAHGDGCLPWTFD